MVTGTYKLTDLDVADLFGMKRIYCELCSLIDLRYGVVFEHIEDLIDCYPEYTVPDELGTMDVVAVLCKKDDYDHKLFLVDSDRVIYECSGNGIDVCSPGIDLKRLAEIITE